MANLETIKTMLAEQYEYLVVGSNNKTVSLMSKKTRRYERSYETKAEALKAIAGLNTADSLGLTVKKSKKVVKKPQGPTKHSKKEADALMAYYSRKSGSYTGD